MQDRFIHLVHRIRSLKIYLTVEEIRNKLINEYSDCDIYLAFKASEQLDKE